MCTYQMRENDWVLLFNMLSVHIIHIIPQNMNEKRMHS